MTTGTAAPHAVRLLAGYHALGRPAELRDHLAQYGPPPTTTGASLVQAVEEAGLTGRGGGGFPTGRKLRSVAAGRRPAVVVVNAAEGEPASAKDRALLTVAPHLVLDGAALAAGAVGAREIVVCVHAEPDPGEGAEAGARRGRTRTLADTVRRAVAERERARPAPVPMRVTAVLPRYVASEETSLVRWIDTGDARPSFAPRPFERGVGGRPTLVSNAETFAHIALIARYGPAWFRSCGSEEAPGTALFTVSGAVARPGVVEAPLGTPVGEVLRLAGGPSEPLQAVLAGGYGGTWLPPELLALPTTPSAFKAAGLALGPGILVALPERACGVAESARVLAWLAAETAGQCGPCVHGLPAIAADFAELASCRVSTELYRRLDRRLAVIPGRGACRHPDGAVRFAASALRVFGRHLRVHTRAEGCLLARWPSILPIPEEW
ncbi:NADH-ubiquinone oxidoreductase-F iron-sulfur binding region domain-containing protein [Actinoallomurus rhizosphaericola]|uniref:NADH-ubiquinone oxidoreductase-F iron-sulfur binding region domain-containing protein n=1 Tax=Actinoallomurus rhizosphaericola TaxID=2952536 RepID=UPI002091BBC4|nr:NADH-ubiquinone oxidoreductase-F iron-sulfur binding region domain-containing protein [Actinoallomurus rhizosphaericola]MCO5993153.1 SLBB domain-containing protein [Actinoallomurus rhizosphaericola]